MYQIRPHALQRIPRLRWKDVAPTPYKVYFEDIFKKLGGKGNFQELLMPDWDIELEGGIAVCLDETLHFNRYRLLTLQSEFYQKIPNFPTESYMRACRTYEQECLKSGTLGNTWTSPYSEKLFGKAESLKTLEGNGAPRWKLLAFTDVWQDLSFLFLPIKVMRLSVWEQIMVSKKLINLNDLLLSPDEAQKEILTKYLTRKINNL
jgi:hypothetical protein